ncbi:MAG: nuclear transport factor 2 family protein [Chloroflexi bacterium]|nr:MAG: nuclear transport factor 2 family protein [Chloroflexota bacterium]
MTAEQIKETSLKFFDSLNQGDINAWLATLASDVKTYEPVGTPANEGHDGVMQWLQNMSQPVESMTITVDEIFVAGRSAAIRWSGHAVFKNGNTLDFAGIDVHDYNENGKIQTVKGYFDPTPMMEAMGV